MLGVITWIVVVVAGFVIAVADKLVTIKKIV